MRYRLDANGYVESVFWGCYSNGCAEYTGTVPYGYTDLNDWSENALINAYYLVDGNLTLDSDKLKELEAKIEQDTIDNEPLYRKDLYGTNDVLDTQYQSKTATGKVLVIDNVKKINPKVKITDIECYDYSKVDIITQGKNMLKNDAITETIADVTFTRFINGGIRISGTATADIEYNLSGSGKNTTSIFSLKKGEDYYLNIGGLDCEMKYYDGTTSQVYVGSSGLINLSENKEVTQVLIKIPSGTSIEQTIYPMLEHGTYASEYEEYKHRLLTIDFSEYIDENPLYPSEFNIKHSALKTGTTKAGVSKALKGIAETTEALYPSDDLFPSGTSIDYIYIENGSVYISVNGVQKYLLKANVNLFDGFNTVYTMQDATIEMTYCIDIIDVESLEFLQGKSTTTNKFRILEDGSIEAHNGFFSGEINGGSITVNGNYTESNPYVRIKSSNSTDISPVNTNVWENGISVCDYRYENPSAVIRTETNDGFAELSGTQVNAYGFNNISKEKTKKNFEKFKNGLDIIKKSDIYKYNWKNEKDEEKKHMGLVIPKDDKSKYSVPEEVLSKNRNGIDLYSMISVAWQSIKELNEKIEKLEKELKKHKNKESDTNEENII